MAAYESFIVPSIPRSAIDPLVATQTDPSIVVVSSVAKIKNETVATIQGCFARKLGYIYVYAFLSRQSQQPVDSVKLITAIADGVGACGVS